MVKLQSFEIINEVDTRKYGIGYVALVRNNKFSCHLQMLKWDIPPEYQAKSSHFREGCVCL